jgi:transcriptional regulator with XRE-family HTH domain
LVPPRLHESSPERIGPLLKRLRLARGLSQPRLAEHLCDASSMPTVTRHEVSRWEREERLPASFWLRWLAVVLDAPLQQLEAAVDATRGRFQEHGPRRDVSIGCGGNRLRPSCWRRLIAPASATHQAWPTPGWPGAWTPQSPTTALLLPRSAWLSRVREQAATCWTSWMPACGDCAAPMT